MNEQQFVNDLENKFIEFGCKTWREVTPLECKDWKNPFRVDLIVFRQDIGYIGIEAKRTDSFDKGAIIAKAFEQIKKYREKTYFKGIKIDRWAIALPVKSINSEPGTRINLFVQHFLGFYGVEVLRLEENRICISENTKKSLYIKNLRRDFQ